MVNLIKLGSAALENTSANLNSVLIPEKPGKLSVPSIKLP